MKGTSYSTSPWPTAVRFQTLKRRLRGQETPPQAKRPSSGNQQASELFPAIYTLIPLVMSMHRTAGSDTQALIKAIMVKRVNLRDDVPTDRAHGHMHSRRSRTALLHRCFSFVLQQALFQHTRRSCEHGYCPTTVHGPQGEGSPARAVAPAAGLG